MQAPFFVVVPLVPVFFVEAAPPPLSLPPAAIPPGTPPLVDSPPLVERPGAGKPVAAEKVPSKPKASSASANWKLPPLHPAWTMAWDVLDEPRREYPEHARTNPSAAPKRRLNPALLDYDRVWRA